MWLAIDEHQVNLLNQMELLKDTQSRKLEVLLMGDPLLATVSLMKKITERSDDGCGIIIPAFPATPLNYSRRSSGIPFCCSSLRRSNSRRQAASAFPQS